MAINYTVRMIDRLLRFDTTADDVIVTMLPFAQTPNAPYEIHKTSVGDGHTVTIQVDPTTSDFLLPGGSTSLTLDDTNNTVQIKIPAAGLSPAWVSWGSGGGGGGAAPGAAPPVTIDPVAEVIFRNNGKVEVDVAWTKASSATAANFAGVAVYLEDPDISSGSLLPLDGSVVLDASAQVSGDWAPARETDSFASPAVVSPDSKTSYTQSRNVRIYLAAFGPGGQPTLVRANDTTATPTPNIMVEIPIGPGQGQSGMEWAFLVENPAVNVQTDYDRPDPKYNLVFAYDPPDPSAPVPPGVNRFGGARIVYVYYDSSGNPIFPGTDTGIDIPVAQAASGYKSSAYDASANRGHFRVYFCSEDDSMPLGMHVNSLVDGVTPMVDVTVEPAPGAPGGGPSAPDVGNFQITAQKVIFLLDGGIAEEATFAWDLATGPDNVRYAGVHLYLVDVTGTPPLTPFPYDLSGLLASVDTGYILDIPPPPIPPNPETWTIAAISVDSDGVMADDPTQYGQPGFHSPTVTWTVGPPQPGSPGSGVEHAPLVTLDAGASASATDSVSADGVGMVSFDVGTWTNPADNQFGNAQVAMVINYDTTKPTMWSVPANANSFTTPSMPTFGNFDAPIPVDFYILSDDPQGNKNELKVGTTPVIHYTYTPTEGAIIPARDGWFSSEFSWGTGGFQADSFAAKKVLVGSQLIVGGAPSSFSGDTQGSQNGQIAAKRADGTLVAWMGQSEPNMGQGQGPAGVYGGWFGQIYIGGTNPLDAPIFVDNQGIIEVGGIAAAQGSAYPYISIRDDRGYEKGRIGAKLNVPSGSPFDAVGPSPPAQLTSGAWFTQLGVGGNNISNWCVLILPDPNNPLGSQFQMRNLNLLSIDYAARQGSPANYEYRLDMGNSVWTAGTGASQYQFPGLRIYEVDGNANPQFGTTLLSRGIVLRGHQNQGYNPLGAFVMFNGTQSGDDYPPTFWAELTMYSPNNPYALTVDITSGTPGQPPGNQPTFRMLDGNNSNILFSVDGGGNVIVRGLLQGAPTSGMGAQTPVNVYALNVGGSPVIDAAGNWKGKPITGTGSQTPWASNIDGAGFSLANVGSISVNASVSASGYSVPGIGTVIGSDGWFRGAGVAVPSFSANSITTNGGEIDCGLLHSSDRVICGRAAPGSYPAGWIVGDTVAALDSISCFGGYWVGSIPVIAGTAAQSPGAFIGPGIQIGDNGIQCGSITIPYAPPPNNPWTVNSVGGGNFGLQVMAQYYQVTAATVGTVIDANGVFVGPGVNVGNLNPIFCGSLHAAADVDCGSLNVTGQASIGALTMSGDLTASDLIAINGIYVGGPGNQWNHIDVNHYVYGAAYFLPNSPLGRSTAVIDGNAHINCTGLDSTGDLHGADLVSDFIVKVQGWAMIDSDHSMRASYYYVQNWSGANPVINTLGQFVGSGIDVGGGSIYCGYLQVRNSQIDCLQINCTSISASGGITATGNVQGSYLIGVNGLNVANWNIIDSGHNIYAASYSMGSRQVVINANGQFTGPGIAIGTNAISCGPVNCTALNFNGYQCIVAGGSGGPPIWEGAGGVQVNNVCYATEFGIYGISRGWPQSIGAPTGTAYTLTVVVNFTTGATKTLTINGGLITNVTPWP